MREYAPIVITALTSGGFLAFIQWLISRHDKKQDEKNGLRAAVKKLQEALETLDKDLKSKLRKQEKDGLRTQLLVLILLKPEEKQEIMTISEHYFKVLKGDWYMTSIFNKWLLEVGEAKPEWFDSER